MGEKSESNKRDKDEERSSKSSRKDKEKSRRDDSASISPERSSKLKYKSSRRSRSPSEDRYKSRHKSDKESSKKSSYRSKSRSPERSSKNKEKSEKSTNKEERKDERERRDELKDERKDDRKDEVDSPNAKRSKFDDDKYSRDKHSEKYDKYDKYDSKYDKYDSKYEKSDKYDSKYDSYDRHDRDKERERDRKDRDRSKSGRSERSDKADKVDKEDRNTETKTESKTPVLDEFGRELTGDKLKEYEANKANGSNTNSDKKYSSSSHREDESSEERYHEKSKRDSYRSDRKRSYDRYADKEYKEREYRDSRGRDDHYKSSSSSTYFKEHRANNRPVIAQERKSDGSFRNMRYSGPNTAPDHSHVGFDHSYAGFPPTPPMTGQSPIITRPPLPPMPPPPKFAALLHAPSHHKTVEPSAMEVVPTEAQMTHESSSESEYEDDEAVLPVVKPDWALQMTDILICKRLAGPELYQKIQELRYPGGIVIESEVDEVIADDVDNLLNELVGSENVEGNNVDASALGDLDAFLSGVGESLEANNTEPVVVVEEQQPQEPEPIEEKTETTDDLDDMYGDIGGTFGGEDDDLYGDLGGSGGFVDEPDEQPAPPPPPTTAPPASALSNAKATPAIVNAVFSGPMPDERDIARQLEIDNLLFAAEMEGASTTNTNTNTTARVRREPPAAIADVPYILQDMSYTRNTLFSRAARGQGFSSIFLQTLPQICKLYD